MSTANTNKYPDRYESRITLNNGAGVFLRPIIQSDGPLLKDLFNKMSVESAYLRFLRRLNALPEYMVNELTDINYHSNFALVAVIKENENDVIIAVARYGYDLEEGCTDLAVAVRDDWQQLGLGETMLSKVVNIAKDHGITHFTSMMFSKNKVVQKFLAKLGYKVEYSRDGNFYKVDITS